MQIPLTTEITVITARETWRKSKKRKRIEQDAFNQITEKGEYRRGLCRASPRLLWEQVASRHHFKELNRSRG
jgi:hypothetical protein